MMVYLFAAVVNIAAGGWQGARIALILFAVSAIDLVLQPLIPYLYDSYYFYFALLVTIPVHRILSEKQTILSVFILSTLLVMLVSNCMQYTDLLRWDAHALLIELLVCAQVAALLINAINSGLKSITYNDDIDLSSVCRGE